MPRIELARGADEFGSADIAHDAVEGGGVGRLRLDRARRNALGIALAIKRQLFWIGDAKLLADLLPVGVGMRQFVLGRARDFEKPREGVVMGFRQVFVEDIADHRQRSLGAKRFLDRVHADQPPEATRLKGDGVIPECEIGVELARGGLLIEQRGGAEHDIRARLKIEAVALREGA